MIQDSRFKIQDLYFRDPRFSMSPAGRFFVRLSSSAAYTITIAAAFIFSFSDLSSLRAIGFILILFIGDRIVRLGKSEKSLREFRGGRVNVADYLASSAARVLEGTFQRAKLRKLHFPLVLLEFLMERRDIDKVLVRMDVPKEKFHEAVLRARDAVSNAAPPAVAEVEFLAKEAFCAALGAEGKAVEPKDLFVALVHLKDPAIVKLMALFEINDEDVRNAFLLSRLRSRMGRRWNLFGLFGEPMRIRHRIMNRAWSARPTPLLDQVSDDLTDRARSGLGGFLVGHEREYRALLDVLSRPGNPNAMLVGEAGAGKEAMLERFAFNLISDRVPAPLFDHRLVSLSLGSLVAGATEAEIEGRMKRIIEEIERAGNIILYIPEAHNLVRTGGVGVMSAADVLIHALKSDAFSVVGATYPREFKQYIEPVSDVASAFEVVRVQELSEEEAVRLLMYESVGIERETGIAVTFRGVKRAVQLARKYFRQKLLPGSARDLLLEAVSAAREAKKDVLTPDDVVAIAERRVNVPIHAVQGLEAEKLLALEATIHERLIDQDEAVQAVARAIREYRSGLSRRGAPLASFLFVGPTGVGKTELAKILARVQFGDPQFMLRFDMSEYQAKESIARFIGSPDGAVRGALTEAVLEKPYSLILLDEFEKAHPDLVNLFLQVMDDGRLTDNLGRTIDFQNTIIIATSNAHSEFIKAEIERGTPIREISEQLKRKLGDYFRAELLNRFSAIIVFKPLSPEDLGAITKLLLQELAAILAETQGIDLHWDEDVVREVARLGFDPVFGARPLRRVISDRIRAQLADKILKGELKRGAEVKIGLRDSDFTFELLNPKP